jgi:hypothetical protein
MVHVLVYVSSATELLGPAELGEILAVSRRNNAAAGSAACCSTRTAT